MATVSSPGLEKGFSLDHNRILTYSIQCSGNLGVLAIVHNGKLT